MNQAELFSLPLDGRALRNQAMDMVIANAGAEWREHAWLIMGIVPGEVTGEDVREFVESIVGPPHHPNAWGSLINKAVRRGVLVPTGEYRAMKKPSSHARRTPVYRTTGGDSRAE